MSAAMDPPRFRRVAIIGVDGAGAFFKEAETPAFDRIFKDGAVTYSMLTSLPTISAECWGSLLHGVEPELHKLTNRKAMENPYAHQKKRKKLVLIKQ